MSFIGLAAIITLIVVGAYLISTVFLGKGWLVDSIKKRIAKKNAHSVFVTTMDKLVKESGNRKKLSELDDVTACMATMDDNGEIIGDIELIKDKNLTLDKEVEKFLGREGCVVVEV